jgi:hypothetical protein
VATSKSAPPQRRGRVLALLRGGHAVPPTERFEPVVPVYAGLVPEGEPIPVAWVHRVTRPGRDRPEFYLQVVMEGVEVLLPCRRTNRITDPYGVYLVGEGHPWCSLTADLVPEPVRAQLIGADTRATPPEILRRLLPQLDTVLQRSV